MQINAILWRQQFVEKIQSKHHVSTSGVECALEFCIGSLTALDQRHFT
jgi:hypothetical protein